MPLSIYSGIKYIFRYIFIASEYCNVRQDREN